MTGGPRGTRSSGRNTGVLLRLLGEQLDGDRASQLLVLGFVDLSHPALAQLLEEAVVEKSLAGPQHAHRASFGTFARSSQNQFSPR